ncbi:hypothetical protein HPB51_006300 [Rhipicephalus microplus]|uniref:C2H2-type domain-containing protein n=1 Tax=Rhipicephalus microplus TaxID=6941 RepID=A0A9J6ENE7_RHIMP|nr:hypothetical protein HPB51_006300 [Rhipicephalus microplus]
MVIVATNIQRDSNVNGSARTDRAEVVDEAAVALAPASTKAEVVISDSKTAVKNYAKGRISPEALIILANFSDERLVHIIRAPGHSSLPGNEIAHDPTRELTGRTGAARNPRTERDRMISYGKITKHYKLGRVRFPPAHASLNMQQATTWRLLQTNTFPNPLTFHYIYPETYSDLSQSSSKEDEVAPTPQSRGRSTKTWRCPSCSKVLASRSSLYQHRRLVHDRLRPLKCPHCDKAFGLKRSLQDHIRALHTRERPFECPHCTRRLSSSSSLSKHRLVHVDDRPHKCASCGKRYRGLRTLENHARSKHPTDVCVV